MIIVCFYKLRGVSKLLHFILNNKKSMYLERFLCIYLSCPMFSPSPEQ